MLITRDEMHSLQPLSVCLADNDEKKSNVNKVKRVEYILQTNIDHWSHECEDAENEKKKKRKKGKKSKKKRMDHDTMDSIRRLNVGHKCLKERKGDLDDDAMWKLLYEFPIHDKNWTIYSTVMNVQS